MSMNQTNIDVNTSNVSMPPPPPPINIENTPPTIINMKDINEEQVESTIFQNKYFMNIPLKTIDGTTSYTYAFMKDIKYKHFMPIFDKIIKRDFNVNTYEIIVGSENNKELSGYLMDVLGCEPVDLTTDHLLCCLSENKGISNIRLYLRPIY